MSAYVADIDVLDAETRLSLLGVRLCLCTVGGVTALCVGADRGICSGLEVWSSSERTARCLIIIIHDFSERLE